MLLTMFRQAISVHWKELLCRLLTANVTEDIVLEEKLEPGIVALKKIYGN